MSEEYIDPLLDKYLVDEPDDLLSKYLPDSNVLKDDNPELETVPGEIANKEQSKSSAEPTEDFKFYPSVSGPGAYRVESGNRISPVTENEPGPKIVNGNEWYDLRKRQKAGESIDMTKYKLEGSTEAMSEKDVEDHAKALMDSEDKHKKLGAQLVLNQNNRPWDFVNPATEAAAQLRDEIGDENIKAGHVQSFLSSLNELTLPITGALKGKGYFENIGDKIAETKSAMKQKYYMEAAKKKAGGVALDEYELSNRLALQKQLSYVEDFEAGLVNQWNEPILTREQYNKNPPKTLSGKNRPYDEYKRLMYVDRGSLSPEDLQLVATNKQAWAEKFQSSFSGGEDLESGKEKVYNAFDEAGITPLTEEEASAVSMDKGFMEELKMIGQILVQEPDKALKEMGLYLIEDAPLFFLGSKGIGAMSKVANKLKKLVDSKSLRFATRYADINQGFRLSQLTSYKNNLSKTKELLTRPTFARLFGKELAEDLVMSASVGWGHETALGSDYGLKELTRDMTIGLGFDGVSSGIKMVKFLPKPTKAQVADAEKLIYITPGMEKHPDVNRMVKMYSALSHNRALDGMSVHIDPNDSGLKYFTKDELRAADYGELDEGLYYIAGKNEDGKINLKAASGPESVVEETAHFIYDHIAKMAKREADGINGPDLPNQPQSQRTAEKVQSLLDGETKAKNIEAAQKELEPKEVDFPEVEKAESENLKEFRKQLGDGKKTKAPRSQADALDATKEREINQEALSTGFDGEAGLEGINAAALPENFTLGGRPFKQVHPKEGTGKIYLKGERSFIYEFEPTQTVYIDPIQEPPKLTKEIDKTPTIEDVESYQKTAPEPEVFNDGPYSQLIDIIKMWEASVANRAVQIGVEIPTGDELFSSVFTAHMGYADHYQKHRPVVNRIQMPDELLSGIRRVWQDDDILKGKAFPEKPDIIPGDKTPVEKVNPIRDVETVQSEMKNTVELIGKMDDGPEKKALGDQYNQLLKERATLLEAPGATVIPTARRNFEIYRDNPEQVGLAEFVSDLDGEIKDPENAGRVQTLTKIRNQARDLMKKRRILEQPSYQLKKAQTETPEFKKWFGDSKVVDEDGKPLVVYHGTDAQFDIFNPEMSGDFGLHFGTKDQANEFITSKDSRIITAHIKIKNPLELNFDPTVVNYENHFEPYFIKNIQDIGYEAGYNDITTLYKDGYGQKAVDLAEKADEEAMRLVHSGEERDIFQNKIIQSYHKSVGDFIQSKGYDGVIYENQVEGLGNGDNLSYIVFEPNQIKSATENIGTFDPQNPDIRYQLKKVIPSISEQKQATRDLVNRLNQYAKTGVTSKDWFQDTGRLAVQLANGKKDDALSLARVLSLASKQNNTDFNITSALDMWSQYQDQKARGIYPIDMKLEGGAKTGAHAKAWRTLVKGEEPKFPTKGNFYRGLVSSIEQNIAAPVENTPFIAATFGEGKNNPEFMTKIQEQIANRIDGTPAEVQAMAYSSVADRWERVRPEVMKLGLKDGWAKKANGGIEVLPDPKSQTAYYQAMFKADPTIKADADLDSYSYLNGFGKTQGKLSWTALPNKSTGFMDGIHSLPYDDQLKIHIRLSKAMQNDLGENLILKEFGLLNQGGLPSVWRGESSPLLSSGKKAPVDKKKMDMAAAAFGYFNKQDNVGWVETKIPSRVDDANISAWNIGRYADASELQILENAVIKEFGEGKVQVIPTERGPMLKNQDPELRNAEFQNRAESIEMKNLPQDDAESILFQGDGNVLKNDWSKNINGEEFVNAISENGGFEKLRRIESVLGPKLDRLHRDLSSEYCLRGVHDETRPIGTQPGPGLGRSGTDGAIPGTAYQLKRHTETPPPKHSGPGGQSFDLYPEKSWHAFRRVFQDRFYPVKRVQKAIADAGGDIHMDADTYLAETVYYGRSQSRVENAGKMYVDPIVDYMKKKKLTLQEVDDYLYARHAPERNKHLAEMGVKDGSGMSNKEAGQIMANFREEGKVKDLQLIAKMHDKIHKKTLAIKKEGGLIGDEYLAALPDWQNYTPLRGFEDPHHSLAEQGIKPGSKSKGFATNNKERRTMGRKSRPDSRLSNSVAMLNQAVVDAEKNKVGQSFLKMVTENPDGTFIRSDGATLPLWDIDPVIMAPYLDGNGQVAYRKKTHMTLAPNEFSVSVDGKQHIITINDPHLANALKQAGTNNGNMFLRGLQVYNRFLAMINTSMNPEFVLSNFTRDAQTSGFHLTAEQGTAMAVKVSKDVFPALAGSIQGARGKSGSTWSNWYNRYKNAGGKVGWYGFENVEDISGKLQKKLRRTGKFGKTIESVQALGDILGSVNDGVENSFRLATFKNMVEAGMPEAKAAQIAKELTVNFNRKGEVGSVINGLYLFFNASLQGISRMVQATVTNRKMQGIATAISAQGYLNSMYNYGVAGEDDAGYNNWDKVPPWEKERNMIFMDPSGDGQYTKIPMPYGYNIFYNIGGAIGDLQKGIRSEMEIGKDLFMSSISAFNPMGTQNSKTAFGIVFKSLTPSVGQAGIQHLFNENYAGRPIKPENAPWGVQKPDSELFFKGVRPLSKMAAQGLNKATGGTHHRPGGIDVSPEIIDHYWDNFTGGVGKFIANSVNMISDMYNGEKTETRNIPFLRRFRGEVQDYWTSGRYRDLNNKLAQYEADSSLIRKSGSEQEKKLLRMALKIKGPNKQIRQIRKQKANLENKGSDPEKIENLEKLILRAQNRFLRKYREKIEKSGIHP